MHVGRGCVAAHVFLESCARKEVDACFVGECWVARDGNGTQSHPDYVMLGSASRGTKVVGFIRKDLVDGVSLVAAFARSVVVEVGGCRVGGVYCKSTVFYRTPAPIIVYYFPYITCLLYLLFLIKHVQTSG